MTNRQLTLASRPLTVREIQMLRLAAASKSNKQIADEMETTEQTVKNRFRLLYDRLGVGDRAGAVAKALREGVIE